MSIQVEEKSLQLALVKAAGKLGITQDRLSYKVISKNSGFLGLFGKKIAIEAWAATGREKSFERRGASRSNLSKSEIAAISSGELKKIESDLKTFCQGLAERITGAKTKVSVQKEADRLIFNVENQELQVYAKKNPRLIESIEHLLRKQPIILGKELPFRLFVDAGQMRQNREAELAEVAKDLSEKVSQSRRPIVLNYRSSYDRKVIHMALDKDDRVYTKSIGSGANRKLMILPRRDDDSKDEAEQTTSPSGY